MRALSLWEPWATLIRMGVKRVETRSWSTLYRGPLLICAAKGGLPKHELRTVLHDCMCDGVLLHEEDLHFGKAVAVGNLVDCVSTNNVQYWRARRDQWPWGDFSPDRYGWVLDPIQAIGPIPIRGKQGLFEVEDWVTTVGDGPLAKGGIHRPVHRPLVGES